MIYPSDALEAFHECVNNTDVICGLEALARGLLDLPEKDLTPQRRAYLRGFLKRLPPTSTAEVNGHKIVTPAKSYKWMIHNGNTEFPNLYVLFPFDHFFLGRNPEGIQLASNTWDYGAVRPGVQKQARCWYQSAIFLARIGCTADAQRYTLNKFVENPHLRFPAFWTNYGFCQASDTDHGGSAMIGLQEMLMQTDGRRILLGPAWPADWNCNFKLHAPDRTTVEGRVLDGKVVVDRVTPAARAADIEICKLKTSPPPPSPPLSEGKPATASTTYSPDYSAARAVDGNLSTRWSMSAGQSAGWLEVDLGRPMTVGRVLIDEHSYPQTTHFTIEAQQPDGSWKPVAQGGTIGAKKTLDIPPTTAQHFRLHLLGAKLLSDAAGVTVNEFQLLPPTS